MPRVPLLGGSYRAASLIANAQRCVNMYPEKNPDYSQSPVNVTHYVRPGRTALVVPPAPGRGRGVFTTTLGDGYVVIDQNVYYVSPDWTLTRVGQLVTIGNTPVYMADNGVDAFLVDGTVQGYTLRLSSRAFAQTGDPNFLGADRVDFLDYFLFFNQPNSPNWYSTLPTAVTFNGLYFGTKTAWPDNIVAAVAVERESWLLGTKKSEVWNNAGTVPFPFQPLAGIIVEHGCAGKYSPAKQDVNVYWLSQSPEGARMVMKGSNHAALRISTHAIEEILLGCPRVDDAIGACYQIRGHAFYELHLPTADLTLVWDEATQLWHEEAWCDSNGNLHRTRTPFVTYMYGTNVGLDWANGTLYKIDPTNFTDNGQPIKWIRSMPHLLDEEFDRVTYNRLIADVQVGSATGSVQVATSTSPWSIGFSTGFGPIGASGTSTLTEMPEISLRMSRDRGASWGNRIMIPLGNQGQYCTKPTWNRLGYASDMVFELSCSTPMMTALNGVFCVTEPHDGDHA